MHGTLAPVGGLILHITNQHWDFQARPLKVQSRSIVLAPAVPFLGVLFSMQCHQTWHLNQISDRSPSPFCWVPTERIQTFRLKFGHMCFSLFFSYPTAWDMLHWFFSLASNSNLMPYCYSSLHLLSCHPSLTT